MDTIFNYISNSWIKSDAIEFIDVINPATQELIAKTPLSTIGEVDQAVEAAAKAFVEIVTKVEASLKKQ